MCIFHIKKYFQFEHSTCLSLNLYIVQFHILLAYNSNVFPFFSFYFYFVYFCLLVSTLLRLPLNIFFVVCNHFIGNSWKICVLDLTTALSIARKNMESKEEEEKKKRKHNENIKNEYFCFDVWLEGTWI